MENIDKLYAGKENNIIMISEKEITEKVAKVLADLTRMFDDPLFGMLCLPLTIELHKALFEEKEKKE